MNLKNTFVEFLADLYCKFFKTNKTPEQIKFIDNLFYVFIATGIAKGLLFIINIVGGRLLGPSLYGEYTLIISVASFLIIPIGFGVVGGLVKSLAETDDFKNKKKIISTSCNYFLVTIIFFTFLYLLTYKQIAQVANIGSNLILLTIALSVIWSINTLFELILQGLHEQKKWAIFSAAAHILSFGIFIYLYFKGIVDLTFIFIPIVAIYIFYILFSVIDTRKYYSIKIFSKKEHKKMFQYGLYVFVITLGSVLLGNADKIMLGYFSSADAVGIYQAHYLASIMLIGILSGLFIKVFFPTIVKLKDSKGIVKKINKIILMSSPLILIGMFVAQIIILALYNYKFEITTAILFAISAVVTTSLVVYSAILSSIGKKQVKIAAIITLIGFVINVILNYYLIPIFAVNGAAISTLLTYILITISVYISLKKHKR